MVNIVLSDLESHDIYSKLLQTIEDICDQYSLSNDFGTISTANQSVVDFLLENYQNFSVDAYFTLENTALEISYSSTEPLFEGILDNITQNDREIISYLTDDIEYNADNKMFTITFHVKPKFGIHRQIVKQTQLQTKISHS